MKCAAPSAPVMNHLRPRDHAAVALLLGARLIMPGSEPPPGCGSVIAKAERTLPSTIGRSHFSFCAGVPVLREQIHVAVVRRHAIDRERPKERARRLLVDRRPGDDRQVHAADIPSATAAPTGRLFALARTGEPRLRDVLVLGEILRIGFERQHVLLDERAHAQAKVFDLGRQREIHGVPYPLICTTCPPSTTMVAPVM